MKKTSQLRKLFESGEIATAPGCYDGMSARLIENAGFTVAYASGGAISRSTATPDLGILSLTEVVQRMQSIVDATSLPVIGDFDTGFGNYVNVKRAIREFERTGIAACHMEDQVFPKRCGHLDGKELISTDEMTDKIKVAKDTLQDPDFTFIARTDAIAVEGLDAAIERGLAYHKAGADMLFIEAPQTVEQIEMIGKEITCPKLINMFYGGKTPLVPRERLQELNYQLIIIPSDLQRTAIHAMQEALKVIKRDGDSSAIKDKFATFDEREAIVRTKDWLKIK